MSLPSRPLRGYITLISILAVSAMGTLVASSLILLGLGSSRTSLSLQYAQEALTLSDACTEKALQEIRYFTLFAGNGELTLGSGYCTFIVLSQGGENRTIEATGTVDTVTKKVEVVIDNINPLINVTSWVEVQDF